MYLLGLPQEDKVGYLERILQALCVYQDVMPADWLGESNDVQCLLEGVQAPHITATAALQTYLLNILTRLDSRHIQWFKQVCKTAVDGLQM